MSCDEFSITLRQGQYHREIVTVTLATAEDPENPLPLNLTGYTIEFESRSAPSDVVPVVSRAIGSGVTLLAQAGATLGQFELVFVTATTSAVPPGRYGYELWAISGAGARHLLRVGSLVIEQAGNLP